MVVPLTFLGATGDMDTGKATMRREYRQKRDDYVAALSAEDLAVAFSRPPSPLAQFFRPGAIVAGYIAKDSEANPSALLSAAHDRGCVTALPFVTSRTAPMQFLRWSPGDTLQTGPYGLSQPPPSNDVVKPDVILVPLVAFDSRLMRLGQGAGHYDRALSVLPKHVAIGIAWAIQQAPAINADPWDVPMDFMLTEKWWMTS